MQDLWYFATTECRQLLPTVRRSFRLRAPYTPSQLTSSPAPLLLASNAVPLATHSIQSQSPMTEVESMRDVWVDESTTRQTTATPVVTTPMGPITQYVSEVSAVCTLTPQQDFDTVIAHFPFGSAVLVMGYHGEYAQVFWSHHEGWVKKDALTTQKQHVWPVFTPHVTYDCDTDQVQKLRLLIGDTFGAGRLGLPLQAGEWVLYRLREQNRTIPWTVNHGRIPGDWQNLLRGARGVHSGIVPKTGSIMEWRGEEGLGRVAYVEKVTPDRSVTLSVVGYDEPGLFTELVLTEQHWRELRPVFIEVL